MTITELYEQTEAALTGESPPRNVVEALIRVVRDLPAVGKDEKMAGESGGYKYRGIEAMTAAAQPLFGRHGVLVCPRVLESTTEAITKGNKPWVHRTMKVEYVLRGPNEPEDWIVVGPFVVEADDNSDKSANKCLTQALKQMLLQVLLISDRKDDPDEASQGRDESPQQQEAPGVGSAIAEAFYKSAEKAGVERATVDTWAQELAGASSVSEVPRTHWNLLRDKYAVHLQEAKLNVPPAQENS